MAFGGYGGLQVLVVDDFNNFRIAVIKMLEEFGCQNVASAIHGKAAIKHCGERAYDLVLCDYNLGQGKNGQQVLEELRHKNLLKRESLFVMVSAESSVSTVLSAYDDSPDAYLTKPITGNTLRKRLDRLLLQRQEMMPVFQQLNDGNTDAAIAVARTAINSGSRYATSYQKLLGDLFLKNGDLDEAEAVFKKILEVRALDWAQVGMSTVKLRQGDVDTSIEWLKKILKDNPYCMQAYDLLAEAYDTKQDLEAKQKILESAVGVSPKSILRQTSLAETAEANNDFSVAAKAYSRSVRLGAHSCHDRLSNHMQLGRVSVKLFDEHDSHASDVSREALRTLENANKHFTLDSQVQLQTQMLECQLLHNRGEKLQASKLYDEVREKIDSLGDDLTLDSELDLVSTYRQLDQKDRADQLLKQLLEKYKDDEAALRKIDQLLEEPVSDHNRKQVARLNKEGIGHYKNKDYKAAIECFSRAKRLFPNHLGVHLNLVQAMASEMKEYGIHEEQMDICLSILKKVESRISTSHPQFNRYRQLQDMMRVLSREAHA
ncbi:MAG: response regulator [Candidatus Pelagadaptatus aseana]|uniref:response regulator n=1 Tax=Candidatus Pelagadaptatus aseana TaxID=3120508 RepID=UPI0039B2B4E2